MKPIFTYILLLITSITFSQIKAVTEDGKKVLLNNDKSWQYEEDKKTESNPTEDVSLWKTNYYVDDFGDKTDNSFKSFTDLEGKFSNSATSGAKLFANILIDENNIRFDLYEYGRGPSAGEEIGSAQYTLKVKTNNETFKFFLTGLKSTFILKSKDRKKFLEMLNNASSTLKCYFEVYGSYGSSTYNFVMQPLRQ